MRQRPLPPFTYATSAVSIDGKRLTLIMVALLITTASYRASVAASPRTDTSSVKSSANAPVLPAAISNARRPYASASLWEYPNARATMRTLRGLRGAAERRVPTMSAIFASSGGGTDTHATGHCEGATGNAVIIEKRLPAAA